jgi:hypothetical protein
MYAGMQARQDGGTPMDRKFAGRKGTDIRNAGRLFFEALFGEPGELERRVGDDLDRAAAARGEDVVIPAVGHSLVRCAGCAREQAVPVDVDVRVLQKSGWRFHESAWRCPFCVSK